MFRLNQRGMVKKVSILVSLAAATLLIGHGCSQFAGNSGGSSSSSVPTGTAGTGGGGTGFTPIPNALTVSLVYNKQILDNYVACSGIGRPSVATTSEWQRRQDSFAEYGYATDITAPMLMAITALTGEICNDLLNIETTQPAASRRIFNAIDFAAGPSAISGSIMGETVRRLSRACWARDEFPEELNIITADLNQSLTGLNLNDPAETRKTALLLCTGMLSSLSGYTL